jgi:hypothetical protein
MSFYDVPIEVVILIAQFNPSSWYSLTQIDKRIAEYTRNNRIAVEDMLIQVTHHWPRVVYSLPNGVVHRNHDLPAIVWINNSDKPYSNNKIKYYSNNNQYNALSSWHSKYDSCYWYKYGRQHRDNGKPAKSISSSYYEWWVNGKYLNFEFNRVSH